MLFSGCAATIRGVCRWGVRGALPSGLIALGACGGNATAPVEDRQQRSAPPPVIIAPPSVNADAYRVAAGDTLYSIAFRYGLDFRKLAAANRISAPYTIYVGQRLVLREGALPSLAAGGATGYRKPGSTPLPKPKPSGVPPARGGAASASKSDSASTSGKQGDRVVDTVVPGDSAISPAVTRWRWPTRGQVVRRYKAGVHKGIDIDGSLGDPVVAVADGKVVYAGTGIIGLGELLIVKHNEVYISAYAHNQRLLVNEGDAVRAGQRIALKGRSGTDRVKLHFELRKAGKPIDPLTLLPKSRGR